MSTKRGVIRESRLPVTVTMDCDGTSALHQRNKAVAAAEMRKSEIRRRLEGN